MTQKRVVPIDGSTVSHHAIVTLAIRLSCSAVASCSHFIADTKKQIRTCADRFSERHTSPTACPPITTEEAMKVTTITLSIVLALSSSLTIASGAHANGAAHGGPSSHRMSNRLTPGVMTPGSITGMGRGAAGGMYRDNDPNVYRDGLPRDDVNPHGG
jgi:hypothetical protein